MRSFIFAAAFAALAAAAPAPMPQAELPIADMAADFAVAMAATSALGPEITAIADPVDYVPSAAAASDVSGDVTAANTGLIGLATAVPSTVAPAAKRDATSTSCPGAVQPTGYGPKPTPDTASAFTAFPDFATSANTALTPAGYSKSFTNLTGASQQIGYLGLYTLDAYDPAQCAAKCDAVSSCLGFNLYFERDPSIDPDYNTCTNPASTTNIKCTLYGFPVSANYATNTGQYRASFQVVIAGSNGYTKYVTAPSSITNFTLVGDFNNASINAPLDKTTPYGLDSGNTYIQPKTDTSPYNPAICATYCQAQTAYNKAHPATLNGKPVYKACNYFNQYILMKDGDAQGTVCSLYTESWNKTYAVNTGYWSTDSNKVTHRYTITESWGYAINGAPDCGGVTCRK